jgi:hypothetical protein
MARSSGLAYLVRHAFASGLDLTFAVAAGFGLIGCVVVFGFVRPGRPAGAEKPRSPESESVVAEA